MTAVVVVEAGALALLGVLVFSLLRTQARIVAALRDGHFPPSSDPRHTAPPLSPTPPVDDGTHRLADGVVPGPAGSVAPGLAGVDLHGQVASWEPEGPAVLAFLTSGCVTCGWWWGQLRRTARLPLPSLVVVTPDPATDSPLDVGPLAGDTLRVIMSSDGWSTYGVRGGSTFVVVEGGRIRASGAAADWDALMALVAAGLSG